MNYLLTNHRLNRFEPVQVKLADFSKLTIKTIQVKLLDASKTSRKFPFTNPRYGQPTAAEVRIVTKAEITKLRKKVMWLKSCKSCLTFIQANFLISLLQRLNQLVHVALKPQHLVLPMVLLTLAVLQYVVQVMASPGETPACTQRQAMADVQERQAWLFPKTEHSNCLEDMLS